MERITLLGRSRDVSAGEERMIHLRDFWRHGDWIEIFVSPWLVARGATDFEYDQRLRSLAIWPERGDICEAVCSDMTPVSVRFPDRDWKHILPPAFTFRISFDLSWRDKAKASMSPKWKEDWIFGGMNVHSIHAWREV